MGTMAPMMGSDLTARGQRIRLRREAHGIHSIRQWEALSGVARSTITKAEAGISSEESVKKLEQVLDSLDQEHGRDTSTPPSDNGSVTAVPSPRMEPGTVEALVEGPSQTTSWKVTFHSHPDDLPQVMSQIERLLKSLDDPPPIG